MEVMLLVIITEKYYCLSAPSEHVARVCVCVCVACEVLWKAPDIKNAESNDTTTNTCNDKIDLQLSSWQVAHDLGATVVCPTILTL